MDLMNWLFGRKALGGQAPSTRRPAVIPQRILADFRGEGKYLLDIVGESRYQRELNRIAGGKTEDGHKLQVWAFLIQEDENEFDDQAVKVQINGLAVGYLSKDHARLYRQQLAATQNPKAIGRCPAMIVGGCDRGDGDEGHFGVKLDAPSLKRLAQLVRFTTS